MTLFAIPFCAFGQNNSFSALTFPALHTYPNKKEVAGSVSCYYWNATIYLFPITLIREKFLS